MVDPRELLDACRVAEEVWNRMAEPMPAIRREIDALWEAYEALGAHDGGPSVPPRLAAVVAVSAAFRRTNKEIGAAAGRTGAMLAAWRRAEEELSHTVPGTLTWAIMRGAVETAREAYQVRIASLSDATSDDGSIALERLRSN